MTEKAQAIMYCTSTGASVFLTLVASFLFLRFFSYRSLSVSAFGTLKLRGLFYAGRTVTQL